MKRIIVVILLLFLFGCAKFDYNAEFNPVGRLGSVNSNKIILKSPDEVAVYLKSSPEGFTLKENELQVKDGYNHKIIGEVIVNKISFTTGSKVSMVVFGIPTLGYYPMFMSYSRPDNAKDETINTMKKKAFEKGANALIYCVVNVSNDITEGEYKKAELNGYGRGWAVKVDEKYLK